MLYYQLPILLNLNKAHLMDNLGILMLVIVCFFFRDNAAGILTVLLRCCWIMKSTANQCAFVRAEFVEILLLLLQSASSYKMPESDFEGEPDASWTVSEVPIDGDVGADLDATDLQCLDEIVNYEIRLLLEFDGSEKACENEVRGFR